MESNNPIVVINKYKEPKDKRTFYIGRGAPLGNPFVITDKWDRDFVIDLYSKVEGRSCFKGLRR